MRGLQLGDSIAVGGGGTGTGVCAQEAGGAAGGAGSADKGALEQGGGVNGACGGFWGAKGAGCTAPKEECDDLGENDGGAVLPATDPLLALFSAPGVGEKSGRRRLLGNCPSAPTRPGFFENT